MSFTYSRDTMSFTDSRQGHYEVYRQQAGTL